MFPFGKYLEKLASLTVRKQKSKEKEHLPAVLTALDERFLDSPSFAIEMCKNAVQEMADISRNAIEKAIILQNDYSDALAGEVETLERTADTFEDRLGSYLVKLAGRDLNNEDCHMLSLMFHAISNIERISDHAINLTEAARKMKAQGLKLSEQGSRELESLGHVIKDIVDLTTEAFTANEIDMAVKVEPLEEVIDDRNTIRCFRYA